MKMEIKGAMLPNGKRIDSQIIEFDECKIRKVDRILAFQEEFLEVTVESKDYIRRKYDVTYYYCKEIHSCLSS